MEIRTATDAMINVSRVSIKQVVLQMTLMVMSTRCLRYIKVGQDKVITDHMLYVW